MTVAPVGTPTTADNAAGTSSASIVLNLPTGAAVGEVLVCHITVSSNGGVITPPAGWTALQNDVDLWGPNVRGALYYRVVTGSETSTYTWSLATSTNRWAATMFRVSGANTTTPFRTSALATANAQGASSSIVTGPSLTGVQATDTTFYFWSAGDNASAAQSATYTVPTSPWTTIFNRGVSSKGAIASYAVGSQSAPTVSGGTTGDSWVVIGAAMQAASVSFSGSAALSGSGTLAATGKPIPTGSIALSGSGTLSASGQLVFAGSAVLSGAGALTAAGVPSILGSADFSSEGTLTLTPMSLAPSGPIWFRGVIAQRRMPVIPPITALINYSLAVLRINGQWVETEYPTEEQLDAADLYFPGGYLTPIDSATAELLIAAGYTIEAAPPPEASSLVGVAVVGVSTVG